MCRNTPKIYDVKSKDNHNICTQVVGQVGVNCELTIRILDITTLSLRLRLKLYGMLT